MLLIVTVRKQNKVEIRGMGMTSEAERIEEVESMIRTHDIFQKDWVPCNNCFRPTSIMQATEYDGLCYTCIREEIDAI